MVHLGKVQMITRDDKILDVNLRDISPKGVGVEIPLSSFRSRKIAIGHHVRFKCRWNSRLLDAGYFIVTNIRNQQIGLEKI